MASAQNHTSKHCTIHDVYYGKSERCSGCERMRASMTAAESPRADLSEYRLREGEYREDAKYLRRKAREWLSEGTAGERSVAIKAFEAASRYERLALDIRKELVDIEHIHWLDDRNKVR